MKVFAAALILSMTMLASLASATDLVPTGDRVVLATGSTQPRYDGAVAIGRDHQIGVGYVDSQTRAAVIDELGEISNLDLSGLPGNSGAAGITLSELGQLGVTLAASTSIVQIPIVEDSETPAKMRRRYRLSRDQLATIPMPDDCEISRHRYSDSEQRKLMVSGKFGVTAEITVRIRFFDVFVHCGDRGNFVIEVEVLIDDEGAQIVDISRPYKVSPGDFDRSKVAGPIAVIPGGASARLNDGRRMAAYLSAPDAVPTLVIVDADADPDDPNPPGTVAQPAVSRAGFSSNIDLCTAQGRENAWLSWTNSSGQAVLARYVGAEFTLLSMGASDGPVDLACASGGEVLVSWVTNNSTVNLALVDATMQIIGTRTESISAASSTRSAVAVSASGAVALVWGPSLSSGSGANLELQRYQLTDFIKPIDLPRGTWINADGSGGEGWFLDLVQRANGDIELIATYFGYESNATMPANEAMWLIAQGTIVNGSAQMPVLRTSGGSFNSTGNSQNVLRPPWGSARADLLGCNLMRLEVVDADGNNAGFFFLEPAEVLLAGESFCHSIDNDGGTAFESRFPLTWFAPAQSGEGIFFHVLQRASGPPALLAANYTYANDGSGTQLWLFGSAPITQNSVVEIPMFSGRGTGFGANFDTNASTLTPWGTIRVERTQCNELIASWSEAARFGAGSITMQPLTLANLVEDPCG